MNIGRREMDDQDVEGLVLSILTCLLSAGFFGGMMVALFRIATGA